MEPRFRAIIMVLRVIVLAACAHLVSAPPALAQPGGGQPDPRVQVREYLFEDTNEQIPYAVFVSSTVRPDTSAPLVIALHGLGGTHMSLMRGNALDLAEEGGYILVGPMGYNPRGWYGVPATGGGRGRGAAATPPAGAPPAPPAAPQAQAGAGQPPATGAPPQGRGRGAFAGANDPPNVRELSEKDVMNVLERVRKEFNVDDRRTYIMGHSMGGAGTFHLAVKYPENWAAAAAIAPAAFGMDPTSLSAITDMPMMIVHGDGDTVVPVSVGRTWAESMRELKMTHAYLEIEGGDHGTVITIGMPDIFRFFSSHAKPETR